MRRLIFPLTIIAAIVLGALAYYWMRDDGWRPLPGGGEIRFMTVTLGRSAHVVTGNSFLDPLRIRLGPRWAHFLGPPPLVADMSFSQAEMRVWFATRHTVNAFTRLSDGTRFELIIGNKKSPWDHAFGVDNRGDLQLIAGQFDSARWQPRLHIRVTKGDQVLDFDIANPFPLTLQAPPAERALATPPLVSASSGLPYGLPVRGKPGYARSPFAPESGEIDLGGFSSGTEVRCPSTQKLFLVP